MSRATNNYKARFALISEQLKKLELDYDHVVNPVDPSGSTICTDAGLSKLINLLKTEDSLTDGDALFAKLKANWTTGENYSAALATGNEQGMFKLFNLLEEHGISSPDNTRGFLWSGADGHADAEAAAKADGSAKLMQDVPLTRVLTNYYEQMEYGSDYHGRIWGVMSATFVSGLSEAKYFASSAASPKPSTASDDTTATDDVDEGAKSAAAMNSFFTGIEQAILTTAGVSHNIKLSHYALQGRNCPMTGKPFKGDASQYGEVKAETVELAASRLIRGGSSRLHHLIDVASLASSTLSPSSSGTYSASSAAASPAASPALASAGTAPVVARLAGGASLPAAVISSALPNPTPHKPRVVDMSELGTVVSRRETRTVKEEALKVRPFSNVRTSGFRTPQRYTRADTGIPRQARAAAGKSKPERPGWVGAKGVVAAARKLGESAATKASSSSNSSAVKARAERRRSKLAPIDGRGPTAPPLRGNGR